MNRDELRNNVDTIVVVMMENRSFDHVLGHLRSPLYGNRADVEGVADVGTPDYLNPNSDGQGISPFWTDDGPTLSDLPHDPDAVATQLAYSHVTDRHEMTGFVKAFEDEFHTSVENPPVMGLLKPDGAPITTALAGQYTICDHWFACIPTSTAPNRLMSMCGYSGLRDTGTFLPDQQTVYDWMLARSVRWRVYSVGLPFFLLMPRLFPLVLTSHFRRIEELERDLATDSPDDWPQVIFIEPDYHDSPVHREPPCDNHPPLAMAPGEVFLARVYNWLSRSDRWSRTVFILTYDEHGGFWDHMAPLPIKYVNSKAGVSFESTGPRIPAIVAGPFARQAVSKVWLDNTSILQLIADRFGKAGEAYSSEVVGRMQQGIVSVSSLLSVDAGNSKPCALPEVTAPPPGEPPVMPPNKLRKAFDAASEKFVNQHGAEALAKYPELRKRSG